ncbi:A/G-specific adenine glycosylase [Propionibacteriaceae bacterium Y2011]
MDRSAVVQAVVRWYDRAGRDLPWRAPGTTAWGVMVSEFMLQQTPVARVVEPWQAWLRRWPTPTGLAAEAAGEAVRAWGRLGYPRRALRLHAAARVIVADHGGQVPDDHAALLALPGVGSYTAAAIASFAYGQRHVVLDTNVRRVLTRLEDGQAQAPVSMTRAEVDRATAWLPRTRTRAAKWAVASMELGALVCTARAPGCERCPVSRSCSWHSAGRPANDGPPRRGQAYEGTDRQCRGVLLAQLRATSDAVPTATLLAGWPDPAQAARALAGLLADGLAVRDDDRVALPR